MQELVELVAKEVAAERERGGYQGNVRIYTFSIGQRDQVAVEWEYKDLAEYEKLQAEWRARPTTPRFLEKWRELVKWGGTTEVWNLAE